MSKDVQKKKNKDKYFLNNHSKSLSCSQCGSSRYSDHYKVDKDDEGPRGVKHLKPVNTHFTAAVDFKKYVLQKQSQEYNRHRLHKISVWATKMDALMKTALYKLSDPIFVLSFLDSSKTTCESYSIHEGAAMSFLPLFIRQPAKAALSHLVEADKKNREQESEFTTYCQVINYFIETHDTEEVIAKAEANMTTLRKHSDMTAARYSQSLWKTPK